MGIETLAMMQAEILALARRLLRERGCGDADVQRFSAAYALTVQAEALKYGDEGQRIVQDATGHPPTVLEMYVLMHRLRRETVLLIGTALVNGGWTPEEASAIQRAVDEALGE